MAQDSCQHCGPLSGTTDPRPTLPTLRFALPLPTPVPWPVPAFRPPAPGSAAVPTAAQPAANLREAVLALEKTIERPHFAGAQALEADTHAGKLIRPARFDPANLAPHLNRLSLRGNAEADLQPGLQGKRFCGFHKHTSERDVACGGDPSVFADDDLDF